jgi:hypothetical protein
MNSRFVLLFDFYGFTRMLFVLCVVLCLSAIPLFPKDNVNVVPPGNWGAVENLPQGTKSVRLTFGDRMDGAYLGLDDESIRLAVDEKEEKYSRNDVAEVWQLRVPDRKLNGTLIGMGIGAAGGIATMAVGLNAGANGHAFSDKESGAVLLGGTLIGGGIGALVGAIIDTTVKGDRLLYRAR